MRLYQAKETVRADKQESQFTALDQNGEKAQFNEGDYLVNKDGEIFGMVAESFDLLYRPAKAPKAQAGETKKKGGSSSGSPGKKEKDKAAEAKG